jgi:hypothetical protein
VQTKKASFFTIFSRNKDVATQDKTATVPEDKKLDETDDGKLLVNIYSIFT